MVDHLVARLPEAGNRESARRAGTPHSADRIQPVQPEAADPAMVQLCEAGDVLPVYLPVLFDVEARKQMALNVTPYENQFYLNLTGWREDSRAFTFEFNQRGHQRYVIGEVSAADGSIRHLVDEQTKTFIYYYNNYRYDLDDGKELLWISERDGWRHLYLIDGTNGQVKQQVTKGEWVVRQVDYVDETNRVVYFTASGFNKGEDPYNLHYCRINLDGTGFTDMTPENGNHRVTFCRPFLFYRCLFSPRPAACQSVEADFGCVCGGRITEVRCECVAGGKLANAGSVLRERPGRADGYLGNIYRPMHFDASKSYPVVEFIYAGPHDSHVDKDFKPAHHLVSKLVELGFIVVSIDGMGTSNRSKAFHDVCWKNLKMPVSRIVSLG